MQYLCPVNYLPAAIRRWTLDLEVWIRLAQKILQKGRKKKKKKKRSQAWLLCCPCPITSYATGKGHPFLRLYISGGMYLVGILYSLTGQVRVTVGNSSFCCVCAMSFEHRLTPLFVDATHFSIVAIIKNNNDNI